MFRKLIRSIPYLGIAAFLFACGEKKEEVKAGPPLQVQVYSAASEDVPLFADYVGQTFGQSDVEITSRVEGWVTSMDYQEGSMVKAGQLLYTIDPLPFQNKLDQSKGSLAEARTMLEKARADLARIEPLAAINAVSQRELVSAKAQFGAAQGRVQSAEAAVRNSEIELGYTRIKSPIAGMIGISKVRVGDFVGGSRSILNTVSQIGIIRARFTMAENDLFRLYRLVKEQNKTGGLNREVEMILSDGSVFPQKGVINFTDRQVDPTTGALTFDATFKNTDGMLRPGMYVKIRLLTENRTQAVLIPQKSISEIQGQKQVYVVGDSNKVKLKLIKTGPMHGRYTIVESGLEPGEKVIIAGTAMLRNGMVVVPKMMDPKDSTALDITEN
jgi:membrane fusion protein (multidrug efflux system)